MKIKLLPKCPSLAPNPGSCSCIPGALLILHSTIHFPWQDLDKMDWWLRKEGKTIPQEVQKAVLSLLQPLLTEAVVHLFSALKPDGMCWHLGCDLTSQIFSTTKNPTANPICPMCS